MCGIFGVSGSDLSNAGGIVMEGLKKLEYRGYDSWGIAQRDESIIVQKSTGKISQANNTFKKAHEAIGHSRWATHGGVTKENAHPHTCEKVTLVHNGIFENFSEYKKNLEKKGYIFNSQTDTEVLAVLLNDYLKTKPPIDAISQIFQDIEGRFAIAVMIEGENGIYIARRGSPLIIGRSEEITYFASDIPAFLEQTRVVNYLDDNEMAHINGSDVVFFDIHTQKPVEKRNIKVSLSIESAEKGEFNHFMIKEIFDQKSTLSSAINHEEEDLQKAQELLNATNGIYLVACGTAHKACMSAEYLFATIAGKKINVVPASEMPSFECFINEKTCVMAVSQSGETADILEILERSKEKGAKILSMTNVEGSSIARLADVNLPLKAGIEKAVASTKVFTSQVALFALLAHQIAGSGNHGRQILQDIASSINDMLNPRYEEHIQSIAKTYQKAPNLFIIGRNELYPLALESAIKIMEVSYIHAQGFAAGEMKHGPIALIEEGVPCVVLGDDPHTISNAIELKSRGAKIIGVAAKKHEVFDEWMKIPSAPILSLTSIIPVQIFAYHLALLRGINPDMPRNLAKSVTVK